MNNYKFTSEIKSDNSEAGKYEQYIDLYKAYKKTSDEEYIHVGVRQENDYQIVPGLNIIAGMTGHGKSMLANNIAYRAVQNGLNVAYITLEVSKENMFYQMLSIKSFVNGCSGERLISHSTLKNRGLTNSQEYYVFHKLWPEFKNMKGNLHILSEWDFDTTSSASLQLKLFEVEDYSIKQTGRGIDLLIVDYIQLFKQYIAKNPVQGEYNVLTMWVNDFRKMALNYLGQNREIPIILLSQLNRDAWNDDKARYKARTKNNSTNKYNTEYQPSKSKNSVIVPDVVISLSQIAGCTEIAKSAEQVFAIYSDETFKASNQCLISVIKCRNGETRMEPVVTFMDPKYYIMGVDSQGKNGFDGTLSDLLSDIKDVAPIDFDFDSTSTEIKI